MKNIDIKFSPGDRVFIKPIQEYGYVNYVYLNLYSTSYNVSYFMRGDQKSASLFEDDLEIPHD